jgi:hypothetical protein
LSVMINKPKNKHINAVIYFIDQNLRTLWWSVKANQNISELDETLFSFAEPIKVQKNKEYYVEIKYFPWIEIPEPAKNISELWEKISF